MTTSNVMLVVNPNSKMFVTPFKSNPLEGGITMKQEIDLIDAKGYSSTQTRYATLRGKCDHLEAKYAEGEILKGRIAKQSSFTPFYEGQNPCQTPDKPGNPGRILLKDGKQYFVNYYYSQDDAQDEWLADAILVKKPNALSEALAKQ